MPAYTAPALLIGLSARLALNLVTRSEEQTVRDFILLGVWQGVALQYAHSTTALPIPLLCGMVAKLIIDFMHSQDPNRCAVTVIGIVLGYTCTDLLSQYIDTPSTRRERRRKHSQTVLRNVNNHVHPSPLVQRQRQVQFRRSIHGDTTTTETPDPANLTYSDITTVDTNSDLIGAKSMTPLEREIASLRTQASLADTERRRCKEERKWAVAQGNLAMADELKKKVKHFTSLMQKCHKDADAKVIEASRARAPSLPPERPHAPPIAGPSRSRESRERERRHTREDNSLYHSVAEGRSHSRIRSGTLKSAMREGHH